MKEFFPASCLLTALCALSLQSASGQSIDSSAPVRAVVGTGSTSAADGRFSLSGTVGQSVAGISNYSAIDICHGFWYPLPRVAGAGYVAQSEADNLLWNAPNPFAGTTTIGYDIPEESYLHLRVYDMTGRVVRTLVDGIMAKGVGQVVWDGKDESAMEVATGYYLYALDAQPIEQGKEPIASRRTMLLVE